MKNYQIYKKLRPFILKRLMFAVIGLLILLMMIIVITKLTEQYPDYEYEITVIWAIIGVFVGWKIIRKGETQYRMGQVAMIVQSVTGKADENISTREAMHLAERTFKYARIFPLIKNIIRHKNFKKVGQFIAVAVTNMIPYVGLCNIAWIFAHPEEKKLKGMCRAVTNFHNNRKHMSIRIFKAFINETVFVIVIFVLVYLIETGIFLLIVGKVTNLPEILEKLHAYSDALEDVWRLYFTEEKGYQWDVINVVVVIAAYVTWFIKVFSIRAYQMIGIIKEYLALGEKNPPSDELFERLSAEWIKLTNKSGSSNESDEG